jgi:lysophospholipase L1-like esterase
VLSLVLLEIGIRLRQLSKYGTTFSYYRLESDPESGLEVPAPGQVGPITVGTRGFRGPEIAMPKPAGRLRLAFLGGSTTFCAEVSSDGATWPSLVRAELARRFPDADLDYVNGGAAGYSTEQSLANLRFRVAPLGPDVLVIYHATNDLTQDSRRLAVAQGLYDPGDAEEGWLARHSLLWNLLAKNLRFGRGGSSRTLSYDARELSRPFDERLRALIAEARATGALVAVATFSHQARADQTPEVRREACRSSLYYMPYLTPDDVLALFAEYNRVIREVAAEEGALLIGSEDAIPGDSVHFNDSVHFKDPGAHRMAERVSTVLAESPDFRALVERKASER